MGQVVTPAGSRLVYTRYRLVGGLLQMCRWRWINIDQEQPIRVRFREWPWLEWDVMADYRGSSRSPGDSPSLPQEPRV